MTTQDISKFTKQLYSTNRNEVLSALNTIKKEGDARFLPALLNLYETENNPDILNSLEMLLSNIKDKQAVSILALAVADTQNPDFKTRLISICWNTGLDFAEYLSVFTKIFIESDFLTAFEAFTLIDNTEPDTITEAEIIKNMRLLSESKANISSDKKALFNNIVQMFTNLQK